MIRTLVVPGRDSDVIGLDLADLAAGEAIERRLGEEELLAVVLSGRIDVTVDGTRLGAAGGRHSVFEGPGHAVLVPPQTAVRLVALEPAQIALATAAARGTSTPARIIGPDEQRVAEVGRATWRRTVRTLLGPEQPAGRLLAGETINDPGNWSSYPPHKHDEERPPEEVALEEVYLFRVDPPGGFGVQLRYGAGAREAFVVGDDDVAVIRSGFHPVAAAPGYALYYLWIMAGQGRQMIPYVDPAHAWVAGSGT